MFRFPRLGAAVVLLLVVVAVIATLKWRSGADVPPAAAPADAQAVRVAKVVDGDTLRVTAADDGGPVARGVEERVRLLLVDTPEVAGDDECFGAEATDALRRLAPEGATVFVAPDERLRDRYDRLLLYVWTADGTFVNEALARDGFARVEHYAPNDRHLARVRAAESAAREAGRGRWSACS